MASLKKNLRIFFLYIALYLYIYSPYLRIIGVGSIKFLWVAAIFYYIIKYKELKKILIFYKEALLILLLIVYTTIIFLFYRGEAAKVPYNHIIFFIECLVISNFLVSFFSKELVAHKLDARVINIGFIAALISLILILNPALNSYLRDNIILDDLDESPDTGALALIRGFTFAESSTFGYGVIQGFIFSLCLFASKKKPIYIVYLLPILISIFFNARVGLIVLFIGVLLQFYKISWKFYVLSFLLIMSINLFLFNSNFYEDNKDTFDWAFSFFSETGSFLSHEKSSDYNTFDTLTDSAMVPDNFLGILFGEGTTTMGKGSDVGYINQLFTGGIIYILLLIFALLFIAIDMLLNSKINKFILVFFVITLLVVNFKGPTLFLSQSISRLFFLYIVVYKRDLIYIK